ncbi:MAG: hypothetical protein FWG98_13805 [Candidatus Cloacimonetes bacterium]|nr:hypothetical protein [Candidatus Cloacimonadota bacterium]
MTNQVEITNEKGWQYILLAFIAFFGIALEVVYAFVLGPLVFGKPPEEYTTIQDILHWVVTCITWFFVAYFLINIAKNKLSFDIFNKSNKMKLWQWVAAFLCIAFALYVGYNQRAGFKVILEYKHLGWLRFIFQYLYYFAETVLILLIIIFAQKAFEVWTKKKTVPWGGIICAITWGLAHAVSRGYFDIQTGLLATLYGFLFGAVYLLTNRNVKISFVVLFFMFVL